MSIKFDLYAAERLIKEMDLYCTFLAQDVRELIRATNTYDLWNDKQKEAFKNNVTLIVSDLNSSLHFQGEYMDEFQKSVNELSEN